MINRKIIIFSLAIAAGGFAFETLAKLPVFADVDGNNDGQVSLSEFVDMHNKRMTPEERFTRLDADGNGYLSQTEMAQARGKRPPRERRE